MRNTSLFVANTDMRLVAEGLYRLRITLRGALIAGSLEDIPIRPLSGLNFEPGPDEKRQRQLILEITEYIFIMDYFPLIHA